MLMTETKTAVQQIAEENGWTFREFAGRVLLRGLSYDTAREAWTGAEKKRGFNPTTKTVIARILRRPVAEVFPD